jgi:hypothetical protein
MGGRIITGPRGALPCSRLPLPLVKVFTSGPRLCAARSADNSARGGVGSSVRRLRRVARVYFLPFSLRLRRHPLPAGRPRETVASPLGATTSRLLTLDPAERNPAESKAATVLAGAALVLDIVVLLLPLHIGGAGEFGSAFPRGAGTRLTIGFLIQDFTLVAIIAAGLVLLFRGSQVMASGVFFAAGIFSVLHGTTAPFYALPRLQPMLLMAFRIGIGVLLFLASWRATRLRPSMAPLPPPP